MHLIQFLHTAKYSNRLRTDFGRFMLAYIAFSGLGCAAAPASAVTSDAVVQSAITIHVRDANNNPLLGVEVELTKNGNEIDNQTSDIRGETCFKTSVPAQVTHVRVKQGKTVFAEQALMNGTYDYSIQLPISVRYTTLSCRMVDKENRAKNIEHFRIARERQQGIVGSGGGFGGVTERSSRPEALPPTTEFHLLWWSDDRGLDIQINDAPTLHLTARTEECVIVEP